APNTRYPLCTAGERACPPEDVGGPEGYGTFLEALSDPKHPEHDEYQRWIGGSFDPERFDPAKVRFDSPARRLREVYNI
ncbi:plasmid pRiA4b ORF-3 family protein, partial [Shewanella sp. C31]|nr:plasmid pRiA4b ORF-3 family protein [Shewanella electrica]